MMVGWIDRSRGSKEGIEEEGRSSFQREGLEIGTANLVSYTKEQGKHNVVYVLRKSNSRRRKEHNNGAFKRRKNHVAMCFYACVCVCM
jgi:hypothetical protein